MQINDEMREAAHRVLWERDQAACSPATVTAALEAALSAAEPQPTPSVAVKALEWRPGSHGRKTASVFGRLMYEVGTDKGKWYWLHNWEGLAIRYVGSEDEALLAATTDYDARIRSALSAQVQDVAEYQSHVEADRNLLKISQRLIKWDTDFPVNCWNGYTGLKELDKIIADAKIAVHHAGAPYDNEFGTNHPPATEGGAI